VVLLLLLLLVDLCFRVVVVVFVADVFVHFFLLSLPGKTLVESDLFPANREEKCYKEQLVTFWSFFLQDSTQRSSLRIKKNNEKSSPQSSSVCFGELEKDQLHTISNNTILSSLYRVYRAGGGHQQTNLV